MLSLCTQGRAEHCDVSLLYHLVAPEGTFWLHYGQYFTDNLMTGNLRLGFSYGHRSHQTRKWDVLFYHFYHYYCPRHVCPQAIFVEIKYPNYIILSAYFYESLFLENSMLTWLGSSSLCSCLVNIASRWNEISRKKGIRWRKLWRCLMLMRRRGKNC